MLAHDEFFVRSCAAELETRLVIGMYGSSSKVKCREGMCGASQLIAELKLKVYN